MSAQPSRVCRVARNHQGYTLIDLLLVLALIGVIVGIAVPVTDGALSNERFAGDAQALAQTVSLAKMRAAANFTRARVLADLNGGWYVLQQWNKTSNTWVNDGSIQPLSQGVQFGFSTLTSPPPDTQAAIGQSPVCRAGLTASSAAIGNTACIVFNSRGLPVDGDGAIYGGHALYLTNGGRVAATTVSATPRIRQWMSPTAVTDWKEHQ